jgi:predicted ATPase
MKIAVTGGAAAGKTTLTRRFAAGDPANVALVGEVASEILCEMQVSQRGMPAERRRELQLRIYSEQLRREADAAPKAVVLTDRGTVDAAAYWPDGWRKFWQAVQTSHERELSRYDAVIYLDSTPTHFVNTAWRTETVEEATRVEKVLLSLWKRHPRFYHIPLFPHFEEKAECFVFTLNDITKASRLVPGLPLEPGEPR